MIHSLFWAVTQRSLVITDVSGQPIGLNIKGPIGCPETTVNTNILHVTSQKSEDIMGALHSYERYASARLVDITSQKTVISQFLFVFQRVFFFCNFTYLSFAV